MTTTIIITIVATLGIQYLISLGIVLYQVRGVYVSDEEIKEHKPKENYLDNSYLFIDNPNIKNCTINFDWDKGVDFVKNNDGFWSQRLDSMSQFDICNSLEFVIDEHNKASEINIIGNTKAIHYAYGMMFNTKLNKFYKEKPLNFLIKDDVQSDIKSNISGDYILNQSLLFHTPENGFVAFSELAS